MLVRIAIAGAVSGFCHLLLALFVLVAPYVPRKAKPLAVVEPIDFELVEVPKVEPVTVAELAPPVPAKKPGGATAEKVRKLKVDRIVADEAKLLAIVGSRQPTHGVLGVLAKGDEARFADLLAGPTTPGGVVGGVIGGTGTGAGMGGLGTRGSGLGGGGLAGIGTGEVGLVGKGGGGGAAGYGSGGLAGGDDVRSRIRSILARRAAGCYPRAAARAGVVGMTVVRFCVGADGGVESADVGRSSGSTVLDDAAITCVVKGAGKLPVPPPERRCLTLPVRFVAR